MSDRKASFSKGTVVLSLASGFANNWIHLSHGWIWNGRHWK
jgi:hypothetical protein